MEPTTREGQGTVGAQRQSGGHRELSFGPARPPRGGAEKVLDPMVWGSVLPDAFENCTGMSHRGSGVGTRTWKQREGPQKWEGHQQSSEQSESKKRTLSLGHGL